MEWPSQEREDLVVSWWKRVVDHDHLPWRAVRSPHPGSVPSPRANEYIRFPRICWKTQQSTPPSPRGITATLRAIAAGASWSLVVSRGGGSPAVRNGWPPRGTDIKGRSDGHQRGVYKSAWVTYLNDKETRIFMATHCNIVPRGSTVPNEGTPNQSVSIPEIEVPNCPGLNISVKEKAEKTYIRVMRGEHPVIRVTIDQATGKVESTRYES